MTAQTMPRKNATYRLDDRIVALIAEKAQDANTSANRWLEDKLIELFRLSEDLPKDFRPVGETRGRYDRKTKQANDD
jgi:hypothetical protein